MLMYVLAYTFFFRLLNSESSETEEALIAEGRRLSYNRHMKAMQHEIELLLSTIAAQKKFIAKQAGEKFATISRLGRISLRLSYPTNRFM